MTNDCIFIDGKTPYYQSKLLNEYGIRHAFFTKIGGVSEGVFESLNFAEGVGKTKAPFVYNIAGMWCVRIVGTFICTQLLGLGLVSAWACMIAHNMLLFVLYMRCYVRKRWNPLEQF